jgi:hypothetical protein
LRGVELTIPFVNEFNTHNVKCKVRLEAAALILLFLAGESGSSHKLLGCISLALGRRRLASYARLIPHLPVTRTHLSTLSFLPRDAQIRKPVS